jgi:hypothetical protein
VALRAKPTVPHTAPTLAWTVECLGRYREAETMFRRLLADEQQALGEVLGDEHPSTLTTRLR